MKYILYSIIASLVLLTSCSDASPIIPELPEKNNGKYTVKFSVKNDDRLVSTRSTTKLSDRIKYLEYWVWDENTTNRAEVAHKIAATASEIDAPIQMELPEGKYRITFYATTDGDTQSKGSRLIYGNNESEMIFYVSAPNPDTDAFSHSLAFEVVKNKSLVQEVSLQRIVARIELVIEDLKDLPADIQSISAFICGYTSISGYRQITMPASVFLHSYNPSLSKGGVHWAGGVAMKTVKRSDFENVSKSNPIVFYSIPTSPNQRINIGWYTAPWEFYIQGSKTDNFVMFNPTKWMQPALTDDVVFYRKIIYQFKWEANKVYRYTGKIGSISGNLEVGFDEEWNESTITIE